jgi:hypothetical protein
LKSSNKKGTMSKAIKYTETSDKLIIEIVPKMKPIVKFGLMTNAFLFIITGFSLIVNTLLEIYHYNDFSIVFVCFFLSLCIICVIAGKKFLDRVYQKEIVEVSKTTIHYITKYLFTQKQKLFALSDVTNIDFVGEHKFSNHPLEGKSFDYLGLGVQEKQLQFLIQDGTLGITCNGVIERFGKNIASWDADEIVDKIEKFTGSTFRINESSEEIIEKIEEKNQ